MTAERRWGTDDVAVVATGLVFFGTAFLPWYDAKVGTDSVAYRAWDLGIFAVPAVLLSVYAAVRVVWLHFRPLGPDVPLAPGVEPLAAAVLALALTAYRSLDVPTVPLASSVQRTLWLSVALFAVLLQAVFALRAVARTGFRA